MDKENVLFVNSGSLPIPATSGGAVQQVLSNIAAGLSDSGWDVGVLTYATDESRAARKDFSRNTIAWYDIKDRIRSGGLKGILKARKIIKESLANVPSGKYTKVVIFDPYLAATVKKWNKKAEVIWSAHNERKKTAYLLKMWANKIDKIISISTFLQESIKSTIGNNKAYSIIHNPIRQDWLERGKSSIRIPNSILFCGRLVPEKGLDVLIDAISLMPEDLKKSIKLGIAGATHFQGSTDNEYSIRIKEMLTNCGIDYDFLGFIPHERLINVYDSYEILVVPSTWDEPATLVATEGQSRDCKIVASNTGGLPEMVAPFWKSYMVNRKDPESLKDSIVRLLTKPTESDYSSEVKGWVYEEFSLPRIIQKWEQVITN